MSDCIFCKIVKGEIPSKKVFENDHVLGFQDLHPQAKTHLLFVHKRHTSDLQDIVEKDPQGLGEIFAAIGEYAKTSGLAKAGYRVVTNNGSSAGQSVFHTHFHVLSSSRLGFFGE